MPKQYSRYIPAISLIGDFLLLNLLFAVAFCYFHPEINCLSARHLLFYVWLNFWWFVLVLVFGAHTITRNTSKKSIFFAYIKIIVFFFFFFLMYFQLVPLSYYPRDSIGLLFATFFVLLMGWKFGLYYAFLLYRRWGFNYKNVIIIGDSHRSRELKNYFQTNKWHGYRFLGFIDEEVNAQQEVIGSWQQIQQIIEEQHVDEVYVALDQIPKRVFQQIPLIASDYAIRVRLLPDMGNFSYKSAELIHYGNLPVLQIHHGPLSYWYNRLIKRLFDIALSLLVILLVLSWLTPLLYFLSLLGSRQGVFFKQRRTSIDGGEFTCYKFRSMTHNDDADEKQALPDDPRVTWIGRHLRRLSLDELPQFFNVLRGDMSVVGPRPHMLKHTEEYRKMVKRFMVRHTVKPGITGLAQVNGFRGPITNKEDIKQRVKHDVSYIENWSFNLDLKIIFLTLWVIIKGQMKAV